MMPELLLAMDYMVGVADQPYAATAIVKASAAIDEARRRGMAVVFTKVGYHPGHPEISSRNKVFARLAGTDKLIGASSALAPPFAPKGDEPLLDKTRFSAFSGNGLWQIVRASGATSLVLCGLSTSGVLLSTALDLIDADFDVTILSDACADPKPEVNDAVLNDILASRSRVCTVDEWISGAMENGSAAS